MKKLLMALLVLCLSLSVCAFAEEAAGASLTDIRVRDAARTAIISQPFAADVADYYIYTQADTYGVEFTPAGEGAFTFNGEEVAAGESYVLDLPQDQGSLYEQYVAELEIVAGDATYNYTVIREDPGYMSTDAFKLKTFPIEGGEMYYWLYVPEDYDPQREYPVVLYLHGGGQRFQDVQMVLLRNQAAGSFVKYGYEAIVIAPQCNYTDLSAESNWGNDMVLSPFGQGAYDILQLVKSEYNVDENREYVTGLSMGGIGSITMISHYPEEFAASI
ncbi:MAG: alpha/beta hydrolase-fold protein, partial [Clostridia bacterium]|nr:alpha/beta hydrolase-fold protein [Clostridia bacterium]